MVLLMKWRSGNDDVGGTSRVVTEMLMMTARVAVMVLLVIKNENKTITKTMDTCMTMISKGLHVTNSVLVTRRSHDTNRQTNKRETSPHKQTSKR